MLTVIQALLVALLALAGEVKDATKYPALHPVHAALQEAGVPIDLWVDFTAVAACESEFINDASGDSGLAQGLFQIHWYLWAPWAEDNEWGVFDEPYDMVQNARLAYLIGERYSIPRGRDRWDQWSVEPWPVCKNKASKLVEMHYGVFD